VLPKTRARLNRFRRRNESVDDAVNRALGMAEAVIQGINEQ
jgi:hypothetical protein